MPTSKRLQFAADIRAPVQKVWATMIEPDTYREWTSVFAEGSYYEGSWNQGERIRFLAPGGGGMLAEIAESQLHRFISIRHLGIIENGVEDTGSAQVQSWAPAYENYTFEPGPDGTRLIVDQDVTEEYEPFMLETWPRALDRLRRLCERSTDV